MAKAPSGGWRAAAKARTTRSSASGSMPERMRCRLDREGGARRPVAGRRKARTAASWRWPSRAANSAMAVGPWTPASRAAVVIASTLASECRTPRAERNSGTWRRWSKRLRSRPGAGGVHRQGPQQHRLRPPVPDPAAARPGEAPRLPRRRPARRQVAGAPVARRVHEGLRQQHRMAEPFLHVPRQAPDRQRQRPRGQVRRPARRQHQEPAVVRHQPQPPELLLPRPADPRVPGAHLERSRAPPQQRQPPAVRPRRHVPVAVPEHAPEPQRVPLVHEPVPLRPLRRVPHRPHLDLRQGKPESRLPLVPAPDAAICHGRASCPLRERLFRPPNFRAASTGWG